MEKNNWCLYKHTCPDGKLYFGISNNLKQRWKAMGEQYHSCKRFYYAIRQYGWMNITHEILFDNLNKKQAGELEKEYILKYRTTNPKYGHNMTTGGFGCASTSSFRAVDQYDLEGNFIRTYDSCREAARAIGAKNSSWISHVCSNEFGHKTAHGYIFRYHGDTVDLNILDNPNWKSVYRLDDFGEIVEKYKSIAHAALKSGVHQSSISKGCKNGWRIGGSYWCLADNYNDFKRVQLYNAKKVSQYSLNGKHIATYDSISEASEKTGINRVSIRRCIGGSYKKAGGFIWKCIDKEREVCE